MQHKSLKRKGEENVDRWKVEIVHSLPGRVRVKIRGLKNNPQFTGLLENTIKFNRHISIFKANSLTGRALIIFDAQEIPTNQLIDDINQVVAKIAGKLMPDRGRRKETPCQGTSNLKSISEPEDLAIKTQFIQVVGTGVFLACLVLKRLLWGKSFMSASSKVQGLAAATTIVTGYPILRSGLESLMNKKKLNNDFLISAATIVSLLLKESVTGLVVVWLVNLSTLFQTLTLEKSRKAIKDMLQGKEEIAWLEVDGTLISVPIESLEKGDIIGSHLGEKIPVDGEVISGQAAVSQAIITGESMPIPKKAGDKVFAGSIVEQGELRIRAEKVGEDTSVARIIDLVEKASEVRAPIENLADRYADRIVPLSFGLAALVYLLTKDFKRSMTMLIVACPCAAGLATPTAISAAMGNSAKKGILIKGGCHLEKVGKAEVVLFDKTGTLTEGKPSVRKIIPLQNTVSEERLLQLAASVEVHTNHPLAKAIVQHASALEIPLLEVTDKEVIIGQGIKGLHKDKLILVGNEQLMLEHNVNMAKGNVMASTLNILGQTALYVAQGKILLGIIGVSDKLRQESYSAIKKLRLEGIETIGLITGDCAETGQIVGKELGLDQIWTQTLPEEKVRIVENFQETSKVVIMVGEGINDSPALAKADVGIAMGTGGTDVAIETADVVLANDNPEKVAYLVNLSNHTMQVVKQNFGFAVGINALGLVLGAGKLISPLTAAILHNLSTFGVVLNSSRLLNYNNLKKGRRRDVRHQSIRGSTKINNGSIKAKSGFKLRN
ncbi:copper/silver-translocating P-type ATPase [Desulfosporosinus youngiae DSM 17734]|uniref:Cd(2+)-exporting ATPase n=1 Tax=Desulfosporosinus youngiae DSM 17734 TaxID=768710 RepID=H5XV67_9FIRM|nr:copper/silver-translocating P-type ATPase [Desulfosporosinus youngiae DSM 17734]